jgi:hypothetical protein
VAASGAGCGEACSWPLGATRLGISSTFSTTCARLDSRLRPVRRLPMICLSDGSLHSHRPAAQMSVCLLCLRLRSRSAMCFTHCWCPPPLPHTHTHKKLTCCCSVFQHPAAAAALPDSSGRRLSQTWGEQSIRPLGNAEPQGASRPAHPSDGAGRPFRPLDRAARRVAKDPGSSANGRRMVDASHHADHRGAGPEGGEPVHPLNVLRLRRVDGEARRTRDWRGSGGAKGSVRPQQGSRREAPVGSWRRPSVRQLQSSSDVPRGRRHRRALLEDLLAELVRFPTRHQMPYSACQTGPSALPCRAFAFSGLGVGLG